MNRLLSVVSMGLARRWKTILMFLELGGLLQVS